MNAKPGELCRIVHNEQTSFGGLVDHFVTVTTLAQNERKQPAWLYEGQLLRTNFGHDVQCLPDAWLRPIRGFGNGDEMVQKLGKPEGITA